MNKIRRESDLLEPLSKYIRRRGFRWQQAEVKFYDYRIDLCGYSKALDEIVAIELKMRKWQRALEQSLIYQLCCDTVFAALPKESISQNAIAEFSNHGVGLIAVGETRCVQILRPTPSEEVRDWYRTEILFNLTTRRNERC